MLPKIIAALGLIVITAPGFAFQCYLTVAKDNCWRDFKVTVSVFDYATKMRVLPALVMPKGASWVRQAFSCQPGQGLYYQATYSPEIWSNKSKEVFTSKRIWYLPEKVNSKTEVAWNIPICYHADFASVPLPPKASGNCHCDFASIPKISNDPAI